MKFDVLIVSKDRYTLLLRQVKRIKKNLPYSKIIIVDSTETPDLDFDHDEDIKYYHTPNAKLGYARQKGLEAVSTPYFFMIDDDIVFDESYGEALYNAIIRTPNALAVSPKLIHGDTPEVRNILLHRRDKGASGGVCIINTSIIQKIGGFNIGIHIGEDADLHARGVKQGHEWYKENSIIAYHPSSTKDYILRRWRQRTGMLTPIIHGTMSLPRLLLRRTAGTVIAPIMVTYHTRSLRSGFIFLLYRIVECVATFRAMLGGKDYVSKKDIT